MRTNYRKVIPINNCNACGITKEEIAELFYHPETKAIRYLEVDHINGIHQDNRKENLMILCKYCHSKKTKFYAKDDVQVLRRFLSVKGIEKRALKNASTAWLAKYIARDLRGYNLHPESFKQLRLNFDKVE